MVRNFVFGCLTATVLILVGVGVAAYFFVWRPAQQFLANVRPPVLNLPSAPGGPAASAPSVKLTRPEVEAFVRVRRDVREAVGKDFARFENLYRDLVAGQTPSALELWGAVRDASGVVGRARAAQQAALRREKLSETSYANVRREANRALGVPEVDLGTAAEAIQQGRLPQLDQVVLPPDTDNARLLRPFQSELRATAALGLLGL